MTNLSLRLPVRVGALLLLCAAGMFSANAHAADYLTIQVDRTAKNIASVQDYSGVIEQRGLMGNNPVVMEIAFRRPHEFRVNVTAPAELAGSQTSYHDDELLMYWPKQDLAMRISGFVPPDAASEKQRVEDTYDLNLANYLFGLGAVREVAGKPTILLDQRAKRDTLLLQSAQTQVYDDFSFPLAGLLTFRGGARLDYRWTSIKFNDPQRALPPVPVIPPSTFTLTWDLRWPSRSPEEVAARMPHAPVFPEAFGNVKRERLIVHPESLPAVAAWYHDANYYALVTASRDTGWWPFSSAYGVSVPLGNGNARVVISALNSLWIFSRDGVAYTVMTNLHQEVAYREIETMIKSVETKSPEKSDKSVKKGAAK